MLADSNQYFKSRKLKKPQYVVPTDESCRRRLFFENCTPNQLPASYHRPTDKMSTPVPTYLQFAMHCVLHHPVHQFPNDENVIYTEIEPLRQEYLRIFGSEIENTTIVRVISRNAIVELPSKPGYFACSSGMPPQAYMRVVLEYCGFHCENVDGVVAWKMS